MKYILLLGVFMLGFWLPETLALAKIRVPFGANLWVGTGCALVAAYFLFA